MERVIFLRIIEVIVELTVSTRNAHSQLNKGPIKWNNPDTVYGEERFTWFHEIAASRWDTMTTHVNGAPYVCWVL